MTIFSSSSLRNLFSLTLHVDLYGLWSREVAYVITYKEKVRAEESSIRYEGRAKRNSQCQIEEVS